MASKPRRGAGQSAHKRRPRQTPGRSALLHEGPDEGLDDGPDDGPDGAPEDRIRLVVALIPRGQVTTYGTVARLAGLPNHARLVGRILAGLPDTTRLPWHRVVNAARRLSPRGDPAAVVRQRARLEAEGVRFSGDRVLAAYLWQP